MLGVCKIYPEMGPLEDIEKCCSFSVYDIRESNIACGNCQNWIAADSVSIQQLIKMTFGPECVITLFPEPIQDQPCCADSVSIGQLAAMLFKDSIGQDQPSCSNCAACNGPVNGVCSGWDC